MNFPPVYVISMPNSSRVNVIKSQLAELHIDFTIQEAIDGSKLSEESINELVDLSPRGIRTHLALNKPIYKRTAAYGHFGRNPEADGGFSWEKLDLVAKLKK